MANHSPDDILLHQSANEKKLYTWQEQDTSDYTPRQDALDSSDENQYQDGLRNIDSDGAIGRGDSEEEERIVEDCFTTDPSAGDVIVHQSTATCNDMNRRSSRCSSEDELEKYDAQVKHSYQLLL